MALETLEGLPEEVTKLYAKGEDGKFHQREAGDDAKGLKSALQKEREAREIAEKALKAKQDAEENAKLEAERKALESKGEYEKLSAKDKKDLQDLKAKLETMAAESERKDKRNLAVSLLGPDVIPGDEEALNYLASIFEQGIESAQGVLKVKGDPDKDIKAYATEFKANPRYANFLRGSGASGTGGNPNPGGGAPASARAKYDALMAKATPLTPSENRELVVLGGQLQTELNNSSKKE